MKKKVSLLPSTTLLSTSSSRWTLRVLFVLMLLSVLNFNSANATKVGGDAPVRNKSRGKGSMWWYVTVFLIIFYVNNFFNVKTFFFVVSNFFQLIFYCKISTKFNRTVPLDFTVIRNITELFICISL